MTAWADIYAPLLGATFEGAAFLPITADTPTTIAALDQSGLWFSGAFLLGFKGGASLLLTWHQKRLCLTATQESDWRPFSLNRIIASPKPPWNELDNATLAGVDLFTGRIHADGREAYDVVAARHDFVRAGSQATLWVCTGDEHSIGEGDDLYVGVEAPPNLGDLKIGLRIARPLKSN